MVEAQRQQAKKRKQKKHDRLKQIEEAHEADKAKWLAFSTKVRFVSTVLANIISHSVGHLHPAWNSQTGVKGGEGENVCLLPIDFAITECTVQYSILFLLYFPV